jgi:outer membrane protein
MMVALAVLFSGACYPTHAVRAGPAPDSLRISLDDCVSRALAIGEEMREAEVVRGVAHARYLQARSDALPQLRFHALYTHQAESIYGRDEGATFTPDTTASLDARVRAIEEALPGSGYIALGQLFSTSAFASPNAWDVGLSLEQKVFQGGSIWGSVAAAGHALTASELFRDDTREEVVYRVRLAYLDLLFAERTVRIFELGLEEAETQLARVQSRKENGAVSEYELLRSEVERDNQIPLVTAARERRELAAVELRRLTNLPQAPVALQSRFLDNDTLVATMAVIDTAGVTEEALAHQGIRGLEQAVEARGHAVTVAAATRYPELSLFLTVSQLAYPGNQFVPERTNWLREKTVGFRVNWDLFDGFLTKGKIKEAKADESRAFDELAQGRERAVQSATEGRLELERSADELFARARTVQVSRRALDLANLRYQEGASTLLEVSEARISWQVAGTYEARARRDYFAALALLERVSGRQLFPPDPRGGTR